jgi:hypothetical protein|tara:strand:+ start:333 stop:482 length:150 start_codon:yes stop_codon:yes gene_type:complete
MAHPLLAHNSGRETIVGKMNRGESLVRKLHPDFSLSVVGEKSEGLSGNN